MNGITLVSITALALGLAGCGGSGSGSTAGSTEGSTATAGGTAAASAGLV